MTVTPPVETGKFWHLGTHCNRMPKKDAINVFEHILKGWVPQTPFITQKQHITTFGSCFATHVTSYLKGNGFNVGQNFAITDDIVIPVIFCADAINNTFAVRQQFEWALEDRCILEHTWYHNSRKLILDTNEMQQRTREKLLTTDIFIITLGLSEVWYNRETGEVFWGAIPTDIFDTSKYDFKVSTMWENKCNIKAIIDLIRKYRPEAHIIFTLSPIPLQATFRPVTCITANTVSKSILRVAVDETYRELNDSLLHYFPSYEVVREGFPDPYTEDNRHVRPEIIKFMMEQFVKYYCLI